MNRKIITYGIDLDTEQVISRVGEEVSIPILIWESEDGGIELKYETKYVFEKHNIFDALPHMSIKWTKKINKNIKNAHREFWGMKPIK